MRRAFARHARRGGSCCRSAPPGIRTRIGSLRRRVLVHRARGAESREGIKPSRAVLQTALLSENRLGAGNGNRTHIGSLEDCGPTVERCPRKMEVESARLELASPGCKPGTLPLSYDPAAGREGIEPSLRVLEAQPVTMTLRPTMAISPAPRRGIEPLSPHGQWGCDASRITRRKRRRAGGRAE